MFRKIGIVLLFLSHWAMAQQTDYFELGKQLEIISAVTETLLDNYIEEPNVEVLTNEAVKGMLKKTDRYTAFYDEQQMFDQRLRRAGKISGIGVAVKDKDKGLSVREVFPGTPAEKKGLLPGDLIIEIDGKALDSLNYNGKLRLLKGKPGTKVHLKILRQGKEKEFDLSRQIIERKAVPLYKMLDDKTGYIKLNRFSSKAYSEVLNALMDLKNQGAQYLILDLRGNPGGLLNQAIKITGLFVPKGSLVVYTKGRFEKFDKEYHTKNEPVDEEIPLAVLINKRSASASEIVSGALQDYDRALITGDTSFGKGLVQRYFPLKYGTHMKVTISKYYIPSGRQIQKIDYWHRDKEGHVTRFKKDKSKVFYTKNKRRVYEHGGITPDVRFESDTLDERIKDLIKKDAFFDFNTDYYFRHPGVKDVSALNDEQLLKEFIAFLRKENIDPQSGYEKYLDKALEKWQKKDGQSAEAKKLEALLREIDEGDLKALRENPQLRRQALHLIKKDLTGRYAGHKAQVEFELQDDADVRKTMELLESGEYEKILRKP